MKKSIFIIFGMSLTAIFWGISFYSIKIVTPLISSQVLIFWRFTIATIMLGIAWLVKEEKEKIKRQDLKRICINGILGGPIYFLISNIAIMKLPMMDLSVVSAMQPILMVIMESLIIGTVFSGKQSFTIAIGVIGGIICIDNIIIHEALEGYSLQFIATIIWAIYCIMQKPLTDKYKTTTIMFYQFSISSLFTIPFIINDPTLFVGLPSREGLHLWYLGACCIGIGYSINTYALKYITPTLLSVFLNIGTIVNLVATYFLLGIAFNKSQILGSLLVVLSVIFTIRGLVDYKELDENS